MASLTISVGAITASVSANNAKAAEALDLFIANQNGPVEGTDQEKAQFVVDEWRKYIRDGARSQSVRVDMLAAQATANDAAASIDWS